jgi:hypothetical protein
MTDIIDEAGIAAPEMGCVTPAVWFLSVTTEDRNTVPVLLSGMALPGKRYHLTPYDTSGQKYYVVDPGSDISPACIVLCPYKGPTTPRLATAYLRSTKAPGGWHEVAEASGPHALGLVVARLLTKLD